MPRTMPIHRLLLPALLLVTAAALAPRAHAAFTQVNANLAEARAITPVNSSEVYVGTYGGGVWKTSNATVATPTWARTGTADMRYVNSIAARYSQTSGSATVYVATGRGVFKTTNSGTAWTQLTYDETRVVAVDPNNANNVMAGVPGLGLARSTDGGATWTLVGSTVFDSTDVTSVVYQNSNTLYAGFDSREGANWGGVYKSTDGGATWANWNTVGGALANKFVKTVAVDLAGTVYAGTKDGGVGGIYKQNGAAGGAWTGPMTTKVINNDPCGGCPYNLAGVQVLHLDRNYAVSPGRLWAGSGDADGKGDGGGYSMWRLPGPLHTDYNNWSYAFQAPQDIFGEVNAIATFPDVADKVWLAIAGIGLVEGSNLAVASFANANGGITINGATTTRFSGIKATRANDIAVSGSTVLVAAHAAGVWRSTTGTAGTFSVFNGGAFGTGLENILGVAGYERVVGAEHIAINPTNANDVWMSTSGRGLYRATLPTNAWTVVNETGLDNCANAACGAISRYILHRDLKFDSAGNLFITLFDMPFGDPADNNAGLYRRAAGGSTWVRSLAGPWVGNSGLNKVVQTSVSGWLALVNETYPYLSGNGGVTFPTQLNDATAPHTGFWRLYFKDAAWNTGATNVVTAVTNKGLFNSFNNGGSFAAVTIGTPGALVTTNFTSIAYSPSVDQRLFAGSLDGKLYCSNNAGYSWSAATTDFYSPVTRVKFIGTTLYVITDGNGVWSDPAPACA